MFTQIKTNYPALPEFSQPYQEWALSALMNGCTIDDIDEKLLDENAIDANDIDAFLEQLEADHKERLTQKITAFYEENPPVDRNSINTFFDFMSSQSQSRYDWQVIAGIKADIWDTREKSPSPRMDEDRDIDLDVEAQHDNDI